MDCAFANLDAAGFLQIWQHFDADDNGYIEGKELDDFFRHMLEKLGPKDTITEEKVQKIKKRFMSAYDLTSDGRLAIHELANMILPEDENFLLIFRREAPLDNSVEFMKIWRKYDADSSGYISAVELKGFLKDLFQQHKKDIPPRKLDEYTNTMASSQKERKRDFEKIFAHYDVSKTGALEGPEVDGFVKDMMELVRPSISGGDLDKLREVLLRHCDVNKDGKIQKSELALCLGLKLKSHAH
ncbi:Secretagogin [Labeo rohita]|uniref:Secretagogin n=1 Tax=Labeo rohita TaxID=84645 RepID=A0ABQ8MQT7_LABRO|nr:Secretagogin [Labeo rohita]